MIKEGYQYHRLLTSLFVFSDEVMLAINVLTIFLYGFQVEDYFSTKQTLIIYFTSGLCGNLAGVYFYTDRVYTGGSAAVFSLFALYIAYLFDHF